jgi:hypothetical protein
MIGIANKVVLFNMMKPELETTIEIKEVEWKNQRLRFRNPLVIPVKYDEEMHELIIAEDSAINLFVFAHTKDKLFQEINEQILFMWNKYVKSSGAKFTKDALKLRELLATQLEEV